MSAVGLLHWLFPSPAAHPGVGRLCFYCAGHPPGLYGPSGGFQEDRRAARCVFPVREGLRGLVGSSEASPKILDTSVIIDGRIADITKSGFLEGDLIVPPSSWRNCSTLPIPPMCSSATADGGAWTSSTGFKRTLLFSAYRRRYLRGTERGGHQAGEAGEGPGRQGGHQ